MDNKKQKESKLIATGTYGCVYDPGVSCKRKAINKEKPSDKTPIVSKLFLTPREAVLEDRLNKIVEKIDPDGLFTLRSFGQCAYPKGSISDKQLKKCIGLPDANVHQIVYEHGGIPLSKAIKLYTFEEMFVALGPVIKGLVKLKNNGMVHMDIKHENIVFNRNTRKMSLIDFGLCRPMNRVYYKSYSAFMYAYSYMPPEFANAQKGYRNPAHDPMDNYKELLDMCYLEPIIEKKLHANARTFATNTDPAKIDVYMMGAVILQMACVYNNVFNQSKRGQAITNLVEKMLCLDASKRPTPEEALQMYNKIQIQ